MTPRGAWPALLVAAVGIGPAYALLAGVGGAVAVSLGLSSATLALAVLAARRPGRGPRLLLALALAAGVPVHYAATAAVFQAQGLGLVDGALARMDARLFGALWPHGQLAVAVDRSAVLGPATHLGRGITELLQLAYFSYYVWGYGLLFFLLRRVFRGGGDGAWALLQAFLCAWVGAYLLNFALYLAVPAMGPWWAFPEWYAHPLEGLALAGPIRALIAENQVTPDCFPSGHTALSWITALVALRVAPRYGRLALVAAMLITLATLWLRYHYATDVLAAIPLILVGLAWGGWIPRPRRPLAPDPRPA